MQPPVPPMPPVPPKKSNLWKWIAGIFLVVAVGRCASNSDKSDPDTVATTAVSPDNTPTEPAVPAEPASNWSYSNNEDKMGAKIHTATATATELLDFEFPYNGGSMATLTIRKKGGKTDLYLNVSKGQFNSSYDGGSVRIKFDSKPPVTYSFSGASDGSSDIIFFDSEQSIIKKLKASKRVIIEAEFYNAGSRQIEFSTAGLKWGK